MKLSERMRDTEKLNIPHIVPVYAVMEYADEVAALEAENKELSDRVVDLLELQATPEELRIRKHAEEHKVWHEGCALCA